MNENGNKKPGVIASLIVSLMALLILFRTAMLTSVTISPAYTDPELPSAIIRGTITDRNGNIIALQAPDYGFEIRENAHPSSMLAAFISLYTDENAISIESKIDGGARFIVVSGIPSLEESEMITEEIEKRGLEDSLSFTYRERRRLLVPEDSFRFIGMTDENMHGVSGLEKRLESYLMPEPVPGSGASIEGYSVRLTIDEGLQYTLSSLPLRGDAVIYDENGFILAITGDPDDDELDDLVLSISKDDETVYEKAPQEIPGGAIESGRMRVVTADPSDLELISSELL